MSTSPRRQSGWPGSWLRLPPTRRLRDYSRSFCCTTRDAPSRTRADGSLVPLADQDRGLWRRNLIAEGVAVLQAALARDRLGEYQAQAAIAALHADAQTADETDWVQIVEWYDELVRLTDSPVVRLNRAVAVGQADGPQAGLAALAELDPMLPRYTASAAYLHERAGEVATAAQL